SGNGLNGVQIDASADGNTVQGNFIGLGSDGRADVANHISGLQIESSNNVVRGNVISGNNGTSPANPSDDGVIRSGTGTSGNYIGVASDGQTALANGQNGITCSPASGVPVGVNTFQGNVIAANAGAGISIQNAAAAHVIRSNIVGLAADGSTPRPNAGTGIYIFLGETPQTAAMDISANTVSGNTVHGMYVYGV